MTHAISVLRNVWKGKYIFVCLWINSARQELTLSLLNCVKKGNYLFTFHIISCWWYDPGYSNMSSEKTRMCPSYIITIVTVDNWGSLFPWWHHQMKAFSALLAVCAGNSWVTGEFPSQRPATQSFDVFFDLSLNKRLSKQPRRWWFEMPSCPLWHHHNGWKII